MAAEIDFLGRSMRLPSWHRIHVDDDNGGWRFLTPREVCLLAEIFEDVREKYLRGGPVEELGITLGVLREEQQ